MSTNDHAVTAAEYAVGLRALADLIEEHGLPASRRHPKRALTTTIFVESVAAVKDFAATHDLTVDVNGNHTTVQLIAGPNPNTYYQGTAVLSVVHIDKAAEPEPSETYDLAVDEPEPVPEAVYLELDGVVMKTTSDDSELYERLDYGWQQITEAEAMSWQPLADVDDESVVRECAGCEDDENAPHVSHCPRSEPEPLPAEARTAIADAIGQAAQSMLEVERVDPDDPTSIALPVIGDTVDLHDGTTARVLSRLRYELDKWQVTGPNGARVIRLDEIVGYGAYTPEALAQIRDSRIEDATPSIVQLDRDTAAQLLADAATNALRAMPANSGLTDRLREAITDFRAVSR